jgi:uracil-DNA glycosylase family 4
VDHPSATNEICQACDLCEASGLVTPYMPYTGPENPDVLFINGEVDRFEDGEGEPFANEQGRILSLFTSRLGDLTWGLVNAVRCAPPGGKVAGTNAKKQCVHHLWALVEAIKPKVVVPMGALAFEMLTKKRGVMKHVGSVSEHTFGEHTAKVVPTLMPRQVMSAERRDGATKRNQMLQTMAQHLTMVPNLITGEVTADTDREYANVKTVEQLEWVVQQCLASAYIAVDTETTGLLNFRSNNPGWKEAKQRDLIVVWSVSWDDGKAAAIPLYHSECPQGLQEASIKALETLMSADTPKVFHNAVYDVPMIENELSHSLPEHEPISNPFRVNNVWFDTMLAAHLLNEEETKTLDYLVGKHLGVWAYDQGMKAKRERPFGLAREPLEKLWIYAADDANYTRKLVAILHKMMCEDSVYIKEQGRYQYVATYFYERMMPIVEAMCEEMRINGAKIDLAHNAKLVPKYEEEISALVEQFRGMPKIKKWEGQHVYDIIESDPTKTKARWREFCRAAGLDPKEEEWNRKKHGRLALKLWRAGEIFKNFEGFKPGGKALGEIVWDVYRFTPIKHSQTTQKPTFDKEVRGELLIKAATKEQTAKIEFLEAFGRYQTLTKLYGTYIRDVGERVDNLGFLHPTYKPTGARTGRLSCADPNLQNIPWAPDVKGQFISRFGPEGRLLQADYSQLELRIMAALADVSNLRHAFENGLDPHMIMAIKIFKKAEEEISKAERRQAKSCNFGIPYGRGAAAIGADPEIRIPLADAWALVNGWHQENFEYKIWLAETIAFAQKHGYVSNPFGRRRWINGINSQDNKTRNHAENQAGNTPIQGGAADICAEGFWNSLRFLRENKLRSVAFCQVHDSILFDVPNEDELEILIHEVPRLMAIEYAWMAGIPLAVDVEVGKSWGELEEASAEEISD